MGFWIGFTLGALLGVVLSCLAAVGVGFWFLRNKGERVVSGEQMLEDARDMLAYREQQTPSPTPPSQAEAPVISQLDFRSRPSRRR
jgi:hypothetical protein